MNTTTNTRGVYHAAHVKAVARALQTDDAAHYAADAAHMLEDYAANLRQQAARVDEGMVERAASAFMRVRGLGMARPWEGMLESSRESYRPAFRAALEAALSAQPAERQGEAKPKFFGMACTVAWTELHNAMAADGMSPPAKCGKATRDWIEGIVRDTFTHPAAPVGVPDGGAARIVAERKRQKNVEGWTPEHDASHGNATLTRAAICYAIFAASAPSVRDDVRQVAPKDWPWEAAWWKPGADNNGASRIRELEKAGALIAAEIDRLLADAPSAPQGVECGCRTCQKPTWTNCHFVVCPECGNKRCPHAENHSYVCTGSNEPGQTPTLATHPTERK